MYKGEYVTQDYNEALKLSQFTADQGINEADNLCKKIYKKLNITPLSNIKLPIDDLLS